MDIAKVRAVINEADSQKIKHIYFPAFLIIGKYCPYGDRLEVLDCPAGSFSVGGQSECSQCDPGYKCTDTTKNSQVRARGKELNAITQHV